MKLSDMPRATIHLFVARASDNFHATPPIWPILPFTMPLPTKVCTLEALLAHRDAARAAGRTVVHCHGCFDIVHPGHIRHLQFARSLGDVLVVSVSADAHVGKGVSRPLIPDTLRAASVAALECVDRVYVNPHPTAVPQRASPITR